jgi:hypothetical protein
MRKFLLAAALASAVTLPAVTPTSAEAQSWRHRDRDHSYYDRHGRYREPRRLTRKDHVWRGRDGRYYCKRDNGTTGLIVGAAAGALLGRAIDTRGDRVLGTLLGGAGGAVLGREIDRGGLKCR